MSPKKSRYTKMERYLLNKDSVFMRGLSVMMFSGLTVLLTVQCQLADNRVSGQIRQAPSSSPPGPLTLSTHAAEIPLLSSFQVETSGGVEPLTYEVVSGPGTISPSGLYTAGVALENIVIRVTDAMGESVQLEFSVEAGHPTADMADSVSLEFNPILLKADYIVSDDLSTVVFVADMNGDGHRRVYSCNSNGQNRLALSPVSAGVTIKNLAFNFDQTKVVYLADFTTPTQFELYSVDLDGSQHQKVNNPAKPPLTTVVKFAVSPVDNSVVYVADEDDPGEYDLLATNLATPGAYQLLSSSATPNAAVSVFGKLMFSFDGQHVVFVAQLDTVGHIEVYSSPIGGGGPVKLNSTPITNTDMPGLVDVVGNKVIYLATEQNSDWHPYQATVNVAASSTRSVNVAGDNCYLNGFVVSHDQNSFIINCDLNNPTDLLRVAIGSPGYSEIHPTTIWAFPMLGRFTEDDQHIVYFWMKAN